MQIHVPDNCGNSPRSLLAIEIAVSLASGEYDKLEPLLADDCTLIIAGSEEYEKSRFQSYLDKVDKKSAIEKLDILTSISHGKYAAISSRAYMSDEKIVNSHDLYEFTGAASSAKLRRMTLYRIDTRY